MKKSKRLYYMTSAKWAEVILQEKRLKLSRFHESNDPFELMLIDNRPKETKQHVRLITEHFKKSTGYVCFSDNWHSPMMWAHYAEKHSGVCLGFDVDEDLPTKVDYTDEKMAAPFGTHLPSHGLSQPLLLKILTTKSACWEYESEYRVLAPLEIPDPISKFYYNDLGPQVRLREVILGHRCAWTIGSARRFVGNVDFPVRIFKARPAFGKFEMVEQQNFASVTVRPSKRQK